MSGPKPERPTLWIREVTRLPMRGPEDHLQFRPGINTLVGVPNTGKSKWLRMIDYLLGDEHTPAHAFGDDLAEKYDACRGVIVVAGEEWAIERRWKEEGFATKVSINGEWTTLHGFALRLMHALSIPVLHYPQGSPYGVRTWPELGWRSLCRHIYRRQTYWGDIADRQPESEQNACILQFTGLAEILFSEQYAKLVGLEKRIQQLQNSREQFIAMLQEISRELIDEKELGVALTPESINAATERHQKDIKNNFEAREGILRRLLNEASNAENNRSHKEARKGIIEQLGESLAHARTAVDEAASASRRGRARLAELQSHRTLLAEELERMQRAAEAGPLLSDLKITHCPACDRPVESESLSADTCYLCGRPHEEHERSAATDKRVQFELEQLRTEFDETSELLKVLAQEVDELDAAQGRAEDEVAKLEAELRPARTVAATILPPELAMLDQLTGRLQERVVQLRRIRMTLDRREAIANDIQKIQAQVSQLQGEVARQSGTVNFEAAGDVLGDGINTYLNLINELKPGAWTQGQVDFVLRPREFAIRVGRSSWQSKLGGTLTLLFLSGYHFGLMQLSGRNGCHYPGLCILDFPAQLDGVRVSDSENFVLEPFLELTESPNQPVLQLIAAGSSFSGLRQAHRIELTKVWGGEMGSKGVPEDNGT